MGSDTFCLSASWGWTSEMLRTRFDLCHPLLLSDQNNPNFLQYYASQYSSTIIYGLKLFHNRIKTSLTQSEQVSQWFYPLQGLCVWLYYSAQAFTTSSPYLMQSSYSIYWVQASALQHYVCILKEFHTEDLLAESPAFFSLAFSQKGSSLFASPLCIKIMRPWWCAHPGSVDGCQADRSCSFSMENNRSGHARHDQYSEMTAQSLDLNLHNQDSTFALQMSPSRSFPHLAHFQKTFFVFCELFSCNARKFVPRPFCESIWAKTKAQPNLRFVMFIGLSWILLQQDLLDHHSWG